MKREIQRNLIPNVSLKLVSMVRVCAGRTEKVITQRVGEMSIRLAWVGKEGAGVIKGVGVAVHGMTLPDGWRSSNTKD